MLKNGLMKIACMVAVFCLATTVALTAQTFTRLTKFNGTNGEAPYYGALTQGADGNFYDTTPAGGEFNVNPEGWGTIYQITPNGKVTTIYDFCSQANCADGGAPDGGLMLAANGNFYGATYVGGANNLGTAFEFTPHGKLTTLYTFCSVTDSEGDCLDGTSPLQTFFQATNGNIYGMTNSSVDYAAGTIFQITPAGKFTTVHSFGASEARGLLQANNGNLYGVAYDAGPQTSELFELSASGQLSVLYNFAAVQGEPTGLIQGADGNFYGTTYDGGAQFSGSFYEITPDGQYTLLYSFCSQANCADGAWPNEIIQGTDGNFYGTTRLGGSNPVNSGYGTVFQLTPAGALTTLHTFCLQGAECSDGSYPYATVTQGTDGNLYGTTFGRWCPGDCGTVYKVSMGLAPFVKTVPNFGAAGQEVMILGNNLTGATSVTFNGVASAFQVVSPTYIKAQVPEGATGGTIQITTPTATLSSNVVFQVLP